MHSVENLSNYQIPNINQKFPYKNTGTEINQINQKYNPINKYNKANLFVGALNEPSFFVD